MPDEHWIQAFSENVKRLFELISQDDRLKKLDRRERWCMLKASTSIAEELYTTRGETTGLSEQN